MIARKVSTLHPRRIVFQDVDHSPSICLLSLFVRNILIVLTEAQQDWNSETGYNIGFSSSSVISAENMSSSVNLPVRLRNRSAVMGEPYILC